MTSLNKVICHFLFADNSTFFLKLYKINLGHEGKEFEILQPSYIPPGVGGENNSILPVIGGGKGWCGSLTWLDTR